MMPYTVAQFDAAKQTAYKQAVAKIAGTSPANIDLVITAARRASHGGGKVKVTTTIRAPNAKRLTEIKKTMSADDTTKLISKLNTALAAQGLSTSSGDPALSSTGSTASTTTPSPSLDSAAGRLENTYIAAVALAMLVSLSMSALT